MTLFLLSLLGHFALSHQIDRWLQMAQQSSGHDIHPFMSSTFTRSTFAETHDRNFQIHELFESPIFMGIS